MAQDWRERQEWRNEERRRMEEEELRRVRGRGYADGRDVGRDRYGQYEDYGEGRPYRGYEPSGFPGVGGFGYVPLPEGRDYSTPSGYRPRERGLGGYSGEYSREWSGRGYEETYPHDRERGWWDRAKDEVRSWTGDEDAERRRRIDEANSHHGRAPRAIPARMIESAKMSAID